MIRIGFDAKRAFHNRSGLGNYSRDHLRMVDRFHTDVEMHLYDPNPSKAKFNLEFESAKRHSPHGGYGIFPSLWRSVYLSKDLEAHGIELYHGLSNEIPSEIQSSRVKSVVTIHDLIFERFPEWYSSSDRYVYRRKFKNAAENANRVVAISAQTKSDLVKYYGINSDRIQVIYQSCHEIFKEKRLEQEKKELKERLGLPDDYVLYVGTIEVRKNLKELIESLSEIEIPLVVVGGQKKKYYNEVQTLIHSLGMENRVYFYTNLSTLDLSGIFQLAKLFLYPSTFEGFGIPIIEALFSSVPVISSRGSCFSEAGGPKSIYVNPKSKEELSESIRKVLGDSSLSEQMIQSGLDHVHRFEISGIAKQWQDLYSSALKD